MPKSRTPHPPEFRRKIIELARSGRSIESLAREFEPSANTISNWLKQADLDEGVRGDRCTGCGPHTRLSCAPTSIPLSHPSWSPIAQSTYSGTQR